MRVLKNLYLPSRKRPMLPTGMKPVEHAQERSPRRFGPFQPYVRLTVVVVGQASTNRRIWHLHQGGLQLRNRRTGGYSEVSPKFRY